MALQFSIVIVTPRNTFFSGVKNMSPKMYNAMQKQAVTYSQLFKEEFKVKRVVASPKSPKGWKFI